MERELECPICLEQFESPKVLPCQHTFCQQCLLRSIQGGLLTCAECRAVHPVPPGGFPTNITIQRLLSAAQQAGTHIRNNVTERGPRVPLTPTAPPANFNIISRMSEVSPAGQPGIQREHFVQRNSGLHTQPDTRNLVPTTSSQQPTRSAGHDVHDEDYPKKILRVVRTGIRQIVSTFLRRYTKFMITTTVFFIIITFARFVAGAVKLNSDCPKERQVALYLFVKACFAFLFWAVILVLGVKKRLIDMMDNLFIEIYVVIEALFSAIWFIVGIVWILGNYNTMKILCPLVVEEWNEHFINFAVFLMAVDLIGLVAFCFYSLYVTCDRNNRVDDSAS